LWQRQCTLVQQHAPELWAKYQAARDHAAEAVDERSEARWLAEGGRLGYAITHYRVAEVAG